MKRKRTSLLSKFLKLDKVEPMPCECKQFFENQKRYFELLEYVINEPEPKINEDFVILREPYIIKENCEFPSNK